MRFVASVLLCVSAALAQQVTTVDKLPAPVRGLSAVQSHAPLPCSVEPIKPALNFGFRFQTGYVVRTSLDLYQKGGRHWYIVFRVTPLDASGHSVYFMDSIDLPAPVRPGYFADAVGAFLLGEGRYDVKWSLLDDLGRVCRQEWTLDARPARSERSTQVVMPPDTVGDFSWRPTPAATGSPAKPRHITVLLNAALPVKPQAGSRVWRNVPTNSTIGQWRTLLSILASLVERMPAGAVRLVVFNLDQQRELFRQDGFTLDGINTVAHAADGSQQWAVDYQVLNNPSGGWDLLRDLENEEITSATPPDTVIFLSLPQANSERMPPEMPVPASRDTPQFLYLEHGPALLGARHSPVNEMNESPAWRAGGAPMADIPDGPLPPANQPDPIAQSVRRMKGRSIVISTPEDLSRVIEQIQRGAAR